MSSLFPSPGGGGADRWPGDEGVPDAPCWPLPLPEPALPQGPRPPPAPPFPASLAPQSPPGPTVWYFPEHCDFSPSVASSTPSKPKLPRDLSLRRSSTDLKGPGSFRELPPSTASTRPPPALGLSRPPLSCARCSPRAPLRDRACPGSDGERRGAPSTCPVITPVPFVGALTQRPARLLQAP